MTQTIKSHSGGNAVVPSSDLGPRPTFDWIDISRLVVDETYQRRITGGGNKHINGIVRDMRWAKFQPLIVTANDDGRFAVIDGQHRLEAARRHPDVTEVPCWIVPTTDVAAQASTFVDVNQARIQVTRINVFWAQLAAGHPDAVWLKSVCDRAGVTISRVGTGRQPPLTTVALGDLLRLRPLGDDVIVQGLALLVKACPRIEHAFRGVVIQTVIRILALYQAIDMQRLVDVLTAMDIDEQLDKARIYKRTFGGTIEAAYHAMVAKAYNKGLRNPVLLIPEKIVPVPKAPPSAPQETLAPVAAQTAVPKAAKPGSAIAGGTVAVATVIEYLQACDNEVVEIGTGLWLVNDTETFNVPQLYERANGMRRRTRLELFQQAR